MSTTEPDGAMTAEDHVRAAERFAAAAETWMMYRLRASLRRSADLRPPR